MKLPDFVVQLGVDEDGKHHAFYIDPIVGCEMRGPARETEEEAQEDQMTVVAKFKELAEQNGLVVGDQTDN